MSVKIQKQGELHRAFSRQNAMGMVGKGQRLSNSVSCPSLPSRIGQLWRWDQSWGTDNKANMDHLSEKLHVRPQIGAWLINDQRKEELAKILCSRLDMRI
jgi:hypothetical protein